MSRILVTGATGFLGRHVVDTLLKSQPGPVRIFSRGSNPWASDPRVESVTGDVTDPTAVGDALSGAGAVLHLAGQVSRDPDSADVMRRVHVLGTRNVCEAALSEGGLRVVLASSSGTIAVGRRPVVYTESAPYASEEVGGWPYYVTKIEQEATALGYFAEQGLDVVVLNPSILLGPGDIHGSSTNDVSLFLDRRIPNTPSGGLSFVDVRDAANAFVAAVTKGRSGQRYLLGGHNMTIHEFFGLLAKVSGVPAPRLSLPEWMARGSASLLRRISSLVGRDFPVDDISIQMAYRFWYCDSSLARQELGFEARPPEATLRDTVDDLRKERVQGA